MVRNIATDKGQQFSDMRLGLTNFTCIFCLQTWCHAGELSQLAGPSMFPSASTYLELSSFDAVKTGQWLHSFENRLLQRPSIGFSSINYQQTEEVLHAAVKLICGGNKYDRVTLLLWSKLHRLRILDRVTFKLCLLTFKAMHNLAPWSNAQSCAALHHRFLVPRCIIAARNSLRSATASQIVVPRTCTKWENVALQL